MTRGSGEELVKVLLKRRANPNARAKDWMRLKASRYGRSLPAGRLGQDKGSCLMLAAEKGPAKMREASWLCEG